VLAFPLGVLVALARLSHWRIHGKMASRERNRLRSRIGFVFQNFNRFPHLAALDNIVLSS
jgi:ABC-type polar amino acid transport system ATPase subunit